MELRERNIEIISMRLDKMTFEDIAKTFDISTERVRQIIYKHRNELRSGRQPRLSLRAWWAIASLLSEHTTLELVSLPGIGRTTSREVVDFMHRRGFWPQYNENGFYKQESKSE